MDQHNGHEPEQHEHHEHHHHHHHHHRKSLIPRRMRAPLIIIVALMVVTFAVIVLVTQLNKGPEDSIPDVHTHEYGTWVEGTAPTCTEEGTVGHYQCSCGKYFDKDHKELASIAVPKAHQLGTWVEGAAPTCTAAGTKGYFPCTVCGKYLDDKNNEIADLTIPPQHSTEWVDEVPATGNVPGVAGHYHCTACGKDFDADGNELTDLVIPATGKYVVKITGNLPGGISVTGGEAEQIVSGDTPYKTVTLGAQYGYRFLYFEINGVRQSGKTVKLSNVTDDVTVNVVCEYATTELPIINIDTNGQEISDKENYVEMSFSMQDGASNLNCSGGIRLRGNTTMSFPKKPYRIKFDKKQSLFGLKKAKSWVLLAEYLDPSDLHNYTALTLRREIDDGVFTPTPHMVNVYLNGEYQGIYTLCEQIQENEGRVGNEKPITDDMTSLKEFNFLIVMDVPAETFVTVNVDAEKTLSFQIKYPEKEENFKNNTARFDAFKDDLQDYLQKLVNAFQNGDVDYVLQEVNINSLLDFMIVDQIMGERDHATKSVYMYFTTTSKNPAENGKLNFGPIWDYDWCLYTNFGDFEIFDISENLEYSNFFFQSVRNTPALYQMLKERYTAVGSAALARTIQKLKTFESSIQQSVKLDAEKWYPAADTKFRPYSGYELSQKHTEFLNNFLAKRKQILDAEWLIH